MNLIGEMAKRNASLVRIEDSMISKILKSVMEYRCDFEVVFGTMKEIYTDEKQQQIQIYNNNMQRFDMVCKRIYDLSIGINNTEKRTYEMEVMLNHLSENLSRLEQKEMDVGSLRDGINNILKKVNKFDFKEVMLQNLMENMQNNEISLSNFRENLTKNIWELMVLWRNEEEKVMKEANRNIVSTLTLLNKEMNKDIHNKLDYLSEKCANGNDQTAIIAEYL
jgi:hypothetical protein